MRRDHVASTLIRRHFDNVYLLGKYIQFRKLEKYWSGNMRKYVQSVTPSDDPDQTAHMTDKCHRWPSEENSFPYQTAPSNDWSICTYAQSALGIRWAHACVSTFPQVAAYLTWSIIYLTISSNSLIYWLLSDSELLRRYTCLCILTNINPLKTE